MTVFDEVDAIYCINMAENKARYERMQQRFTKLGLERVERFEAVSKYSHPLLSGLSSLLKNAGIVGCFFSHLQVIRLAKARNLNSVLILEDDAKFLCDIESHWSSYYSNLPQDYKMLMLGSYQSGYGRWLYTGIHPSKRNLCTAYYDSYAAHGYLLSRRGIEEICSQFSHIPDVIDVDWIMAVDQENISSETLLHSIIENDCYVCSPPLSIQDDIDSDIQTTDQLDNHRWYYAQYVTEEQQYE